MPKLQGVVDAPAIPLRKDQIPLRWDATARRYYPLCPGGLPEGAICG